MWSPICDLVELERSNRMNDKLMLNDDIQFSALTPEQAIVYTVKKIFECDNLEEAKRICLELLVQLSYRDGYIDRLKETE